MKAGNSAPQSLRVMIESKIDDIPAQARDLCRPRTMRTLLRQVDLRLSRKLGQHMLADAGVLRAVMRHVQQQKHDQILEIGPGLGSLTVCLAEVAQRVVTVEIDARMLALARCHARLLSACRDGAPGCRGVRSAAVLWRGAVHAGCEPAVQCRDAGNQAARGASRRAATHGGHAAARGGGARLCTAGRDELSLSTGADVRANPHSSLACRPGRSFRRRRWIPPWWRWSGAKSLTIPRQP